MPSARGSRYQNVGDRIDIRGGVKVAGDPEHQLIAIAEDRDSGADSHGDRDVGQDLQHLFALHTELSSRPRYIGDDRTDPALSVPRGKAHNPREWRERKPPGDRQHHLRRVHFAVSLMRGHLVVHLVELIDDIIQLDGKRGKYQRNTVSEHIVSTR